MRIEYEYKVVHMPASDFKKRDIELVIGKMEKDGWILYERSKRLFFFRREKHC